MSSVHDSLDTAVTVPTYGPIRSLTAAAGANTVTRARYRHAPVATRRATQSAKAAGSAAGSGRGVNRPPPGVRGVILSTRKVRQSPRPTSNATRYQRRPQFTSWYGSASRSLADPSCDR